MPSSALQSLRAFQVAMIGAGSISRAHTRSIHLYPGRLALASVCSSHEPAARALAAEHAGDIPVFTDHRQLLRAGKPDAAVIALPHFLHHPVAKDFLEAGVPCLIEKPITCSASELRDLHAIADRRSTLLMAGQMRRFGMPVTATRKWLEESPDHFGELRSFDVVVQVNIDAYTGGNSKHWALDGTKAGGGVIANFGIHRLDLVCHLSGVDFSQVTAIGRFDSPFTNGAESQASVLFRMSNGATGTLHANGLAPRTAYMDGFTLHGSRGSIMEMGGSLRYATLSGAMTREWHHQHEGWVEALDTGNADDDTFVRQLLAFVNAVESRTVPRFNTPIGNFNTIACLDAIAESLRTGKTVDVEKW